MATSGYPALCPADIQALHLQLNGRRGPQGLQAALLLWGEAEEDTGRPSTEGWLLPHFLARMTSSPACQGLKDFLGRATFDTTLGKSRGKLGLVSHLCLPDWGRKSRTHTGSQRYMPDSLQGMWSLEPSRPKLLLTLALGPAEAVRSAGQDRAPKRLSDPGESRAHRRFSASIPAPASVLGLRLCR